MKRKLSRLSRRYASALRKHLHHGTRAGLKPARTLGRQAVAIGLQTLDVARIHQEALAMFEVTSSPDRFIERANIFFAETNKPIMEIRRATLKANVRMARLNKLLVRRTLGLAASNRSLKQGILQRKAIQAALKKSVKHYKELLAESLDLQEHLQHRTHHILTAQENDRRKMSHELQDEIAQTLLGINVQLLTVKKVAGRNGQGLQKEIANTQLLVEESVQSINRFARELDNRQPAQREPAVATS